MLMGYLEIPELLETVACSHSPTQVPNLDTMFIPNN
jgi:hypothetical protein